MSRRAAAPAAVELARRTDGGLRLAAVADTHSQPHAGALTHLAAWRPDVILHAGDIGDRAVLTRLAAIAPVHAVRGNIDDARVAPAAIVLTVTGGAPLTIYLCHIAVAGPRLRAEVATAAAAAGAHLVVCGHSHVPFLGRDRGLALFNPGSIGPRRFTLPIVFGTMTLSTRGLALAHVDAETGAPWTPPG